MRTPTATELSNRRAPYPTGTWDDSGVRRPSPVQALRGLVAGLLTTFLALLFHIAGGGTPPSAFAVALCAAAVCWIAMLVGRARPSLVLLATAIGLAQIVLHTAFSIATATATIAGHGHAGHQDLLLVVTGGGHSMWVAHLLAGVLTVIAVRRGEQVARRLVELARMVAGSLLRRVLGALGVLALAARPLARRGLGIVSARRGPALIEALGTVLVRRGPPLRLV